MKKVLIAGTDLRFVEYLAATLQSSRYLFEFVNDAAQALDYIRDENAGVQLIIIDTCANPTEDPCVRELVESFLDLPVILASGVDRDFVSLESGRCAGHVVSGRSHAFSRLRREVEIAMDGDGTMAILPSASEIVGPPSGSAWGRNVETLLAQIGASDIPVLVQGETGVGKEVLARRIHEQSLRHGKPFLKLNCAALPSELVESELFGFERGAFTGAYKSNPGRFEMAHSGTILLDEIGDMDFSLQAKLLHVLQDHEFQRIGARFSTHVDVRVIAATHCDLERAIFEKRFREDLYYRLNVITIVVPPLRERASEVLPLAEFFLRKHATVSTPIPEIGPALSRALREYEWPGNIRELENVMRKYLLLRNAPQIVEELHAKTQRRGSAGAGARENTTAPITMVAESHRSLKQVEQARKHDEAAAIIRALEATSWNRKKSAVLLNTEYKTFLYKMKKLGIGERVTMTG